MSFRLAALRTSQLVGGLLVCAALVLLFAPARAYGGLLTRAFLAAHKSQVARVLTLGTPYWGAPESIIPLALGQVNAWYTAFFNSAEMHKLAENLAGLYELYPSPPYGAW